MNARLIRIWERANCDVLMLLVLSISGSVAIVVKHDLADEGVGGLINDGQAA